MRRWWRRAGRGERTDWVAGIEARLVDLEDGASIGGPASLGEEVEALSARVGDIARQAVTQDELLEHRLELARLTGELGRLTVQVRALAEERVGDLGDEPDWAASV